MCQAVLNDPRVFALLLRIDEEEAARIRALRWRCDGPLHVAVQARKPRGGLWPRAADRTRLSFCHGQCRRRRTPRSVRFLGRRVYYGVVVVLASALAGELRAGREARLLVALGVPRRTLRRWRQWWLTEFISTPFWTGCGRLARQFAAAVRPYGVRVSTQRAPRVAGHAAGPLRGRPLGAVRVPELGVLAVRLPHRGHA